MPDPISVFPAFVRAQAFPPSGGGGQVVDSLEVTLQDQALGATVGQDSIQVALSPASIVAEAD